MKMVFLNNHLLKTWHHLMLTHGTIGMLPRGNIILSCNNIMFYHVATTPMVPHVNTLLCDKMVGW